MKILQFNIYQCKAGWEWGGLGLKSQNPTSTTPWCGAKISSHPYPTTFARRGKTRMGRSEKRWIKWDEAGQNFHPYAGCTFELENQDGIYNNNK